MKKGQRLSVVEAHRFLGFLATKPKYLYPKRDGNCFFFGREPNYGEPRLQNASRRRQLATQSAAERWRVLLIRVQGKCEMIGWLKRAI